MRLLPWLLLTVAATVSAPTHAADRWTRGDIAWGAAAQTALLADMGTTLDIAHRCHRGSSYFERNPILGRCPSRARVYGYFALASAGVWGVAHLLPARHRKWWLGAVTVVETGFVGHNLSIGLRMRF